MHGKSHKRITGGFAKLISQSEDPVNNNFFQYITTSSSALYKKSMCMVKSSVIKISELTNKKIMSKGKNKRFPRHDAQEILMPHWTRIGSETRVIRSCVRI